MQHGKWLSKHWEYPMTTDCLLIQIPTSAWSWAVGGARQPVGYGMIGDGGKLVKTHRLAWELVNGPIPVGMLVCHSCDNPPCCNADNTADMIAKGRHRNQVKTCCPRGHLYDETNTHLTPTGRRDCRTCRAAASRRYYAENRRRNLAARAELVYAEATAVDDE